MSQQLPWLSPLGLVSSPFGNLYRPVRHGVTLPEAALAFPFRHPAVGSVVVGAGTPSQINDAAQRRSRPVPDTLWSELAGAALIASPGGVTSETKRKRAT